MKILLITLCASLVFSCQKAPDRPAAKTDGITPNSKPAGKTLNYQEIVTQEVKLKQNLNFGSAESSPVTKESEDGTKTELVKLSYYYQDNKQIKITDLDKSKGYCEVSVTAQPNTNGAEIDLIANQELHRSGDSRSESRSKNNLNYEYSAKFKFTFLDRQKIKDLIPQAPFYLECFDVMDLSDLNSTIGNTFLFAKKLQLEEEPKK